MDEIILKLTGEEMEGLQSLCCTADLSRITEKSMRGVSSVMHKIYQYQPTFKQTYTFLPEG